MSTELTLNGFADFLTELQDELETANEKREVAKALDVINNNSRSRWEIGLRALRSVQYDSLWTEILDAYNRRGYDGEYNVFKAEDSVTEDMVSAIKELCESQSQVAPSSLCELLQVKAGSSLELFVEYVRKKYSALTDTGAQKEMASALNMVNSTSALFWKRDILKFTSYGEYDKLWAEILLMYVSAENGESDKLKTAIARL